MCGCKCVAWDGVAGGSGIGVGDVGFSKGGVVAAVDVAPWVEVAVLDEWI